MCLHSSRHRRPNNAYPTMVNADLLRFTNFIVAWDHLASLLNNSVCFPLPAQGLGVFLFAWDGRLCLVVLN